MLDIIDTILWNNKKDYKFFSDNFTFKVRNESQCKHFNTCHLEIMYITTITR